MSQDRYTSRFSTKLPAERKNKWKFKKELKDWAKDKFLKHISDQEKQYLRDEFGTK